MTFTVDFAPGAGPLDVIGEHYLELTGGAGSASTPDHASLDITGNIDVRAELTLDLWTPTYDPVLVSKWTAASNQRSYIFWMHDGRPAFSWSTDGTLANSHTLSTLTPMPIETGRLAVRVEFDVDIFGAVHAVQFYTAPTLAGSWTQLGALVTDTGTTSIFAGTSNLLVGNVNASEASKPLVGRVHAVEVRNDIGGTIVANPNFSAQAVGATSFADSTGKTWTINSPGAIVGFDWVSLPNRLLEASWSEGRDDELDHYGPGEATIVLRNDDRVLDPDHAGGPHFGKLRPRTPFRIREDVAGTPQDRFYGFVEFGFEQGYTPPAWATCTVKLADRLSAVAGLLPDVFEHALLSRLPAGCWILHTGAGTEEIADLSGNGHDGTVAGAVTFGEASILPGHGTSAAFAPTSTTFGRVEIGRSPIIAAPATASLVATFRARSAGSLNFRTLFVQGNGNAASTGIDATVDTIGLLNYAETVNGGGIIYEWPTSVVDGKGHIMFGQATGLAVDTATLSTATSSIGAPQANGVGIGGFPGVQAIDHWDGWICAVAIWNRNLSLADREFILEGHDYLSGLRSDQHVAWALDRIGVPAEHRNLEQGSVVMGPADARGKDALAFIRDVVATEQGEFYVDHRDGGKLRFRGRYARFTDTRSTVSQATFSDLASGVGILVDGLEVAPNGIDGIVNQVAVEWRDGDESVEDPVSVRDFGPQHRQVATQATTATQARSVGEWLVARYAQPRSRVRGIATRPDASANALTAARNVRPGDRVSYRLHPQQVGAAILLDLFVEGLEHSIAEGTVRTAGYRLAPVNTFTPWIWGTSKWDQTKFWG